ncbi:MAG: hypothetical protein KKB31_05975 [Nanoarchaeota archaeon]|nr:hypothetical protein [Nanoarchaeota archaeon]
MKLTLRKNGKYYQAGFWEGNKFILVKHLGTVEKMVSLTKKEPSPIPEQN